MSAPSDPAPLPRPVPVRPTPVGPILEGIPSTPSSAAFFDLDKTIIAGSSALAFSRPFRREGLINSAAVLRSGYAQLLLMLSGADADTMDALRKRITALCTGWEVAQVRSIVAETLHEIVEPMIYAEAAALIDEHHAAGDEVIVLSASGLEVVEPIAALVGADRCLATRMAARNGRYTGEIDFYCYGEAKAEAARTIAAERGYDLADCRAYTDSITDLPLLETVGHPVVVNPDRQLRREAAKRGWPVLTFSVPVRVEARLKPRAIAVGAAGAGVAALAGAGLWSLRVRRRRRSRLARLAAGFAQITPGVVDILRPAHPLSGRSLRRRIATLRS